MEIAIAIVVCVGIGLLSGLATRTSVKTWYATINKPSFNPPNWLFGPVWTILYIIMGIAAGLVWQKGLDSTLVQVALGLFGVQLALNAIWSFIFFKMHNPIGAFMDMVVLWLAIAATIVLFFTVSKVAALLLIPYLLWVTFAALLNAAIIELN